MPNKPALVLVLLALPQLLGANVHWVLLQSTVAYQVIHPLQDVEGISPGARREPPRFDLLKLENYVSMSVQFSRGCPFQCEFCDIITIYGRRPRTKLPSQLIAELQILIDLGWRKQVFIVDDNFIGNHKRALDLAENLAASQEAHKYPILFLHRSVHGSRPAAAVD